VFFFLIPPYTEEQELRSLKDWPAYGEMTGRARILMGCEQRVLLCPARPHSVSPWTFPHLAASCVHSAHSRRPPLSYSAPFSPLFPPLRGIVLSLRPLPAFPSFDAARVPIVVESSTPAISAPRCVEFFPTSRSGSHPLSSPALASRPPFNGSIFVFPCKSFPLPQVVQVFYPTRTGGTAS